MRISKTILFTVLAIAAGTDAKLFGKDKRESLYLSNLDDLPILDIK